MARLLLVCFLAVPTNWKGVLPWGAGLIDWDPKSERPEAFVQKAKGRSLSFEGKRPACRNWIAPLSDRQVASVGLQGKKKRQPSRLPTT